MSRGCIGLLASLSVALGCGGQILGDDGGGSDATADAPAPPLVDASEPIDVKAPSCTPAIMGEAGTQTGCVVGTTTEWSCNGTAYFVNCECPAAVCQCFSHNDLTDASSGSQPTYDGCPSCASTWQDLAKLCGFPSN